MLALTIEIYRQDCTKILIQLV